MTTAAWLTKASRALAQVGIGSSRLDAELILAHTLECQREQLLAHPDQPMSHQQVNTANSLLEQRRSRLPLAQVLGHRQFYGLEFEITPDVLTPRAETEQMVELAIAEAPQHGRLLDVGTGCGAIASAIGRSRPDLEITATDVSPAALAVARRNIKRLGVKVNAVQSDLFDRLTGKFDVITANLPYLTDYADLMPEVTHEPSIALLGGPDGLELYRRFFLDVPDFLSPSGSVLIEADPWQHPELMQMASRSGLELRHNHYFILGFSLPHRPNSA